MAIEAIEGVHGDTLQYHYDLEADVLYVRLRSEDGTAVWGEEDERGFHVLRALDDDRPVGLTIVGFWRQFGRGGLRPTDGDAWTAVIEACIGDVSGRLLAA